MNAALPYLSHRWFAPSLVVLCAVLGPWMTTDSALTWLLAVVLFVALGLPHGAVDHITYHHALGRTLMELDQLDEALHALEEACYLDEDFADAWYDLAIVRSALGDSAGMRSAFTEVYELDCAEPRPQLLFAPDQVQRWAQRAFDMLPEELQGRVADVPVFIAEYPEPWILDDAPWDPRLLGLFDGPTWADLKAGLLTGHAPHVYLFQRNLERVAQDPRDMAREVRVTVHHELGHFLGLDEHDLDERGLG